MRQPWRVAFAGLVTLGTAQAPGEHHVDGARLQSHLTALSEFGQRPEGGVSRVGFSLADQAGRGHRTDYGQAGEKRGAEDFEGVQRDTST